jgi:hypothetical protein
MEQIATNVLPVFGVIGVRYVIAGSGPIARDIGGPTSVLLFSSAC